MLEVVAALVWRDGKFMICQRPAGKKRGLLWEFVGGKVERGETEQQALARECREELGAVAEVGNKFAEVIYAYDDVTVHLSVYETAIVGEIQKLEHNDIRFISVDEAPLYEFCPADTEILEKIKSIKG